jgi:hypothetical protein
LKIKKQIFQNLSALLKDKCPWARSVSWERIRLLDTDFIESEIPAIQLYDLNTTYTHQSGRVEARMQIVIELVMKQTSQGVVDQGTLFDRLEDIEAAVGSNIDLGISGMLHLRYVSSTTDRHTIEPYYIAALEFEAIYLKPFSGC